MPHLLLPRRLATLGLALAATTLLATSCASPTAGSPAPGSGSDPAAAPSAGGFPVTVTSCGTELTLDAAPQRIFLIGADTIPLLDAVGAVDRVVSRTGTLPTDVYDPDLQAAAEAIPVVESGVGETGGSVISSEVVLAADPDLVIGPTNGVDSGALTAAGIPVYTPPAYCPDGTSPQTGTASFQWVQDQVTEYGRMLGATDQAQATNDRLTQQLTQLEPAGERLTAAALYIPQGGGTFYPYGAPSMVTPLFEAAGLDNVYADDQQRVFEGSAEDLLDRDPDVVVLLYSDEDDSAVRDAFADLPAAQQLTAVQQDRVLTLRFPYTDPPTPLSVDGVGQLTEQLAR
ncbi:ABC transporter substrate-binding protein [Auraticoccus monumenti]|uniref:Iron complex transport system substrate-binding protein n=1 Tax=Auraticoccus monumenti TaxID=675864 RepID=A0A1G6Y6J2_9ACTN|nr:ABC transporter substrate-binding protein [Auraticoccus monumenti]SDD85327.1 iron complex transport system substrate-binding protein [Auraticoccus monumenti]